MSGLLGLRRGVVWREPSAQLARGRFPQGLLSCPQMPPAETQRPPSPWLQLPPTTPGICPCCPSVWCALSSFPSAEAPRPHFPGQASPLCVLCPSPSPSIYHQVHVAVSCGSMVVRVLLQHVPAWAQRRPREAHGKCVGCRLMSEGPGAGGRLGRWGTMLHFEVL